MMTSFNNMQIERIRVAVKNWPLDKVVKRASEELLELSLALLHYERNKASTNDILEEMADVRIVLKHLEIQFGDYQEQLNLKIDKCDN